jgi:hypothetical protein
VALPAKVSPLVEPILVPEITITAEGVYWHPVGAEDVICLSRTIFFLSPSPSVRSAAPSTAKANTRVSRQELLTVLDGFVYQCFGLTFAVKACIRMFPF